MDKTNKIEQIFSKHDGISVKTMQDYLSNNLSDGENHEVEKQLVDDPFMTDAFEGIASYGTPSMLDQQMNELNQRIDKKVADGNEKKLLVLPWQKKYYPYFSIAASILLLVGVFFLYRSFEHTENADRMALWDGQGATAPSEESPEAKSLHELRDGGTTEKENLKQEAQKREKKEAEKTMVDSKDQSFQPSNSDALLNEPNLRAVVEHEVDTEEEVMAQDQEVLIEEEHEEVEVVILPEEQAAKPEIVSEAPASEKDVFVADIENDDAQKREAVHEAPLDATSGLDEFSDQTLLNSEESHSKKSRSKRAVHERRKDNKGVFSKKKTEAAAFDVPKNAEDILEGNEESGGEDHDQSNAILAFENGDYLTASQLFEASLANDPTHSELQYFYGMSRLYLTLPGMVS